MDASQAAKLRAEFPPAQVGKLPKPLSQNAQKGKCGECNGYHGLPAVHLDYVGHAAVTSRLLEIDPGWSWEPMATDAQGLPAFDAGKNLWIRLTIAGVTRIGVGDGKNPKECIGDAIRNAAMRFGVALDLWAKEDLHATQNTGAPKTPQRRLEEPAEPEQPPAPTRTMQRQSAQDADPNLLSDSQLRLVNILLRQSGYTERDAALGHLSFLVDRAVDTSKSLTKAEASKVIEALQQEGAP